MSVKILEDGSLQYDVWVSNGSMLKVRRDALDPSDPNHLYNYLRSEGVTPEDYGIVNPKEAMFEGKSRADLIDEILTLRDAVETMSIYGFD